MYFVIIKKFNYLASLSLTRFVFSFNLQNIKYVMSGENMTHEKSENNFWGEHTLSMSTLEKWTFGSQIITGLVDDSELKLTSYPVEEEPKNEPDLSWHRWPLTQTQPVLLFEPVMPDRPVVMRPESVFNLEAGQKARIYIRIPIWTRISLMEGTKSKKLLEVPSVVLSNSWFGDFFHGELCFSISSSIRSTVEPDISRPYMAICPLLLINKAKSDLVVEKMCLRITLLSLYLVKNQLWTDEMVITYSGKNEISQVNTSGKPPVSLKKAVQLAKPRSNSKKSLVVATFGDLLDFAGFGNLNK